MERPSFEPYSAPGYTVVTRLPDGSASGDDTVSLYLHLEHPRRIFTSLPQLAETYRLFRQFRIDITKTYCVCRASVAIIS